MAGRARVLRVVAALLILGGLAGGMAAAAGASMGAGPYHSGSGWGGDVVGALTSREPAPEAPPEASPPADVLAAVAPAEPDRTYVVRRGDTLCAIARRNDVAVRALALANGMDLADILAVGRCLVIPSGDDELYRVVRGDTLWSLARRAGTTVGELARVNGVDPEAVLPVGRVLVLPPAAVAASSAAGPRPAVGTATARAAGAMLRPVSGRVTSGFGLRWGRRHTGIDIAAPMGATIRAAAAGQVIAAAWLSGYGRTIMVRHDADTVTLYAHASAILVRSSQRVMRGQAIARVGSSGRSTGPHLHFEVQVGGQAQNPLPYLERP